MENISSDNLNAPKRGRGRPAGGETGKQRKQILIEATKVFAEKGYDAASIQIVADRAGVDRRLVYHYYKSKKDLYLEVMADIYDELDKIAASLLTTSTDIEEFCGGLVRKLYEYCMGRQELLRLLMWENQQQNASLRILREKRGTDIIGLEAGIKNINALIADGAKRGVCRGDIDPVMLFLSILSMCFYVIGHRWTLSEAFQLNVVEEEFNTKWLDHITKLIVDGIRPN